MALSMVESKAWKSYPSVEWAKGVGDSINEFMNLFDSINKRGYSVPYISMMSSVLSRALYSLSSAAKVMYKSKKYFSFKISIDWMKNLSKNVLLFGKTAQELDKLLGFDEKKFGISTYKSCLDRINLPNNFQILANKTYIIDFPKNKSTKVYDEMIDSDKEKIKVERFVFIYIRISCLLKGEFYV